MKRKLLFTKGEIQKTLVFIFQLFVATMSDLYDVYPLDKPLPWGPIEGNVPDFLAEYLAPRPESSLNHPYFRTLVAKMVILTHFHRDEDEISISVSPEEISRCISSTQSLGYAVHKLVAETEVHCTRSYDLEAMFQRVDDHLRACLHESTRRFLFNQETREFFSSYKNEIKEFKDLMFESMHDHRGFNRYLNSLDDLYKNHGYRVIGGIEGGLMFRCKDADAMKHFMRLKLLDTFQLSELDIFILASLFHAKVKIYRTNSCDWEEEDKLSGCWLYKSNEYNFVPNGMLFPPEWELCYDVWSGKWFNLPSKITPANDYVYSENTVQVDVIYGLVVEPVKPLLK